SSLERRQGAAKWRDLIQRLTAGTDVDPRLVEAVIAQESGGDPNAKSPKGAMGLMQIMPAMAAEGSLKRGMEYDPEANIAAGIKYLGRLQNLFGGNLVSTLAAYNAGPGHHGIPQPGENTDYVARVLGNLRLGDTAATPPPEGPSPSIEDVRAQALDT